MKISVQSLFEDYEDDTVELRRDADTARILEKTMAKLPNARKKQTQISNPCKRCIDRFLIHIKIQFIFGLVIINNTFYF